MIDWLNRKFSSFSRIANGWKDMYDHITGIKLSADILLALSSQQSLQLFFERVGREFFSWTIFNNEYLFRFIIS